MATEQQIARLRTWIYPGDPASLSTEEARDVIYAVHRWLPDHRDEYSRPSGPDDDLIFFEDEALVAFWEDTIRQNSPGGRLLRNIRHARNLRRNEPHLVQTVGRWVQSIPITAALRHNLWHVPSDSDYRIAESRGDWFLSIWADSEQQLTERIARVQAILASADPESGLRELWRQEAEEDHRTLRQIEKWAMLIADARRSATQEEWTRLLSTIKDEMLASGWTDRNAVEWLQNMTVEVMHGRPAWKRTPPVTA